MDNSFYTFCTLLDQLSSTPSRLSCIDLLSTYFSSLLNRPSSLLSSLYLISSQFYPDFTGIELHLGDTAAIKLVCEITGQKRATLMAKLRESDLGEIAMRSKQCSLFRREKRLSVEEVLFHFRRIALMKGNKYEEMVRVMVRCEGVELKYMVRMVEGKLKIGIATQTILTSLAKGFVRFGECNMEISKIKEKKCINENNKDCIKDENEKDMKIKKKQRLNDQECINNDNQECINDNNKECINENNKECFNNDNFETMSLNYPKVIEKSIQKKKADGFNFMSMFIKKHDGSKNELNNKTDCNNNSVNGINTTNIKNQSSSESLPLENEKKIISVDKGAISINQVSISFDELLSQDTTYLNRIVGDYVFNSVTDDSLKICIENVKLAYSHCPVLEALTVALYKYGPLEIHKNLLITPGIPVKPMLARASKTLTEAYNRVSGNFIIEFKYDGERAQIHKYDGGYKVFSRNSEDLTVKYPELPGILPMIESNEDSYILDCEIVAFCLDTDTILPFQALATRRRKDVSISEIKVHVCVFVFDILYLKVSLLEIPFIERKNILRENFREINQFRFAKSQSGSTVEEIDAMFNASLLDYEGVMVKVAESPYKPSVRSLSWVKLKKDYLDGLGDSLDLLVMGAYFGKGKRRGKFGKFLMGCYDNERGVYEAVCRVGTGFTDEKLAEVYEILNIPYEIETDDIIETNELYETADLTQTDKFIQTNDLIQTDKFNDLIQTNDLNEIRDNNLNEGENYSLSNKGMDKKQPNTTNQFRTNSNHSRNQQSIPSIYVVHESIKPDLWVNPSMVWEIRAAGLSRSPIYSAGLSEIGIGISMRFPRFMRVRDDKGIEDVSTTKQVIEMLSQGNEDEDDIFN